MLHKHSFQHIAPAVKQQPIQQGAEGLSCCTHQSTCIPQRCPVQQQSETCIHKGSADTSNCLFLGSSYSGIACTTMSSMTAMLLPAAGSATVAGARGAAQSLLHRRTTTTSFHRSSNRRPLAEQPQQPHQVSCHQGLLLVLTCLGAPAPSWPSDTQRGKVQSNRC